MPTKRSLYVKQQPENDVEDKDKATKNGIAVQTWFTVGRIVLFVDTPKGRRMLNYAVDMA